jgi:hypothetical protein
MSAGLLTEARPLLACECVECPSHRGAREARERALVFATDGWKAANVHMEAVIVERDTLQTRVAALTAALTMAEALALAVESAMLANRQSLTDESPLDASVWERARAFRAAQHALDAAVGAP